MKPVPKTKDSAGKLALRFVGFVLALGAAWCVLAATLAFVLSAFRFAAAWVLP